ncbi:MAG: hypothetical protein JSS09_01180 [Verrucomicrobia bacterium]|nr:hypothetical protein [Verrucomicrobiota bacterium]
MTTPISSSSPSTSSSSTSNKRKLNEDETNSDEISPDLFKKMRSEQDKKLEDLNRSVTDLTTKSKEEKLYREGMIKKIMELHNDALGMKSDLLGMKVDVAALKTDIAVMRTELINLIIGSNHSLAALERRLPPSKESTPSFSFSIPRDLIPSSSSSTNSNTSASLPQQTDNGLYNILRADKILSHPETR